MELIKIYDAYKALRTSLVIERNRVSDALASANRTLVQAAIQGGDDR